MGMVQRRERRGVARGGTVAERVESGVMVMNLTLITLLTAAALFGGCATLRSRIAPGAGETAWAQISVK